MKISSPIIEHFPDISDAQRAVVGHLDGPLLVIAGPGSGKTYSIVLRALNLLLLKKAKPSEIIMCTFTEKAAFEMRDRISAAAHKVDYAADLSELRVSTIHGLCNQLIMKHRHRTPLGGNYEALDELTESLFIFENFDEIIGPRESDLYLGRWQTKWSAIAGVQKYFSKIAEELIDPEGLLAADSLFLQQIGSAYTSYRDLLFAKNRVDFAHLQSIVHGLLLDPECGPHLKSDIRYVLVDEYQDTNYVQEQLLLEMTRETGNLCVVGDEDQSLYRFRGATVRNILEFPSRVENCKVVSLSTNYRSHRQIVERYDRWMASSDWSNTDGVPFRFDKTISADDQAEHPEYPAVISIWGRDPRDEAARFAEFVKFLKDDGIIEDYGQVALLLHSVREEHSGHYLAALERLGIPAFCPRARTYFDNVEIRILVGCFAALFGWHGDGRGEVFGAVARLADYVDSCIVELARNFSPPNPLGRALQGWITGIANLAEGEALDFRPADYLYQLLGYEPFKTAVENENSARNLAIFSQLLNVFQSYYHYTVVTYRNREFLRLSLFNSFLRLLFDGGINEYEDPEQPFPKGYVQVMTIHQAKGLEFPVVIVGSLTKQISSQKRVDRDLGLLYHRPPFEPESRITGFDRMRLHYVAFSRAQNVLVLTASEPPKTHFDFIWQGLPQWPYVERELLAARSFSFRERMPVKRAYSFTGDLKIYETCPRQYQFFREFDFTPSRSAVIFFGLLVHGTIEELHRIVLDGGLETLSESRIRELFDYTFHYLSLSDVRPVGDAAREAAFRQVVNYFKQNRDDMKRVIQTEVDVSLEKDNYILTGKVDLLLGGDGRLELLDFKTSPKPTDSPELIHAYERQLCTYAHILERRYDRAVDRLLLYWTAEERKEDALTVLRYDPEKVALAGAHFDDVVQSIQRQNFQVTNPPESTICKECDLRTLCHAQGLVPQEVNA